MLIAILFLIVTLIAGYFIWKNVFYKDWKYFILYIITIISITGVIYIISNPSIMKKEVNTFVFPDTFRVTNYIKSSKVEIDTLLKVVGNKILNYDTAHIIVHYDDRLLNRLSKGDFKLDALLTKGPLDHTYNLIVRTNPENSLEMILCHEMIHFDQYERGDLQIKDGKAIYLGKEYDNETAYDLRPWEQIAKKEQYNIWKKFKKMYYK